MRTLCVALAALSLGGCTGKAAQCEKEARELGALLAVADTGPEPVFVDNATLVERTDLKAQPVEPGPAVHVGVAELRLDGMPLPNFEALSTELTRNRERSKALYGDMPERPERLRRVVFVVDKATPWSQVVAAVTAAAKAEHDAAAFAFSTPATSSPPPRAPIDDKLDALLKEDPADRARRFAQLISDEVKECKPLTDAFGSVAAVAPTDKAKSIIAAIPPALIACKCQVHMGNLRSAMYRLLANPRPTRLLSFDPTAPKTRLALPGNTTWDVASKRLAPDLRNAELAVE